MLYCSVAYDSFFSSIVYLKKFKPSAIIAFFFSPRYQFLLQVKQDVLQGRLPCPFNIAAQLGAYAIQCRCILYYNIKPCER